MNTKNIIRKIKLLKIGCYKIKKNEMKIFNFVTSNLLNLNMVKLPDYPYALTYFNNDGKFIFQKELNSKYLIININILHENKWIDIDNLMDIIKCVAEDAYKLKNLTPYWITTNEVNILEIKYIQKIKLIEHGLIDYLLK